MYQKAGQQLTLRFGAVIALVALLTACTVASAQSGQAAAATHPTADHYVPVHPTDAEARTSLRVVAELQHHHFKNVALDDAFSSKLLKAYLDDLDPAHSVFLASDVQRFRTSYGAHLDEALKNGNLDPAFTIYNVYQERRQDDLRGMLGILKKGLVTLDLNTHAKILIDRKNAAWPADATAMSALWHKRLENDVISLKLDDNSDADIKDTLSKRFQSQLKRLDQTESRDAFEAYMNAYTRSYDPHTEYFPPSASESFDIHMRLSLEGIGAVLQSKNGYVEIVRLVPGGPASKNGQIHPADRIVAVGQGPDGPMVDVVGMRLDEVVQLIRGPKSSTVRLKISPANAGDSHQTRIVRIVREEVTLKDQAAQKKVIKIKRNGHDYKIGVITLPTFYIDFQAMQAGNPDYRSSTRDVHRLLDELEQTGVDGVIIDLRNNGGGALQEATELTGLFIPTGPIVQIRDASNRVSVLGDRDPEVAYKGPMAVLVNRLSASASEIFTGAIQDYGRGLVLGGQTFGKGTVQTLIPLKRGQLKLTEAMFYRVSGDSTQLRGVIPDIHYPPIYNHDKIGESALPNALPWGHIPSVPHTDTGQLVSLVPTLRRDHEARAAHDPNFQYLKQQIALFDKIQKRDSVSLNLAERRAQQDQLDHERLALANRHQVATGKKPFKTIAELEASGDEGVAQGMAAETAQAPEEKDQRNDPYLHESGEVLVDLIRLKAKRHAPAE